MASFLLFAVLVGFAIASETLPAAPPFTWNFSSINDTETLLSCATYFVLTTENASPESGQYSLRAFSPNVTPIYMDVGNNASSLQWQVPFPSDFQVMLGMLDSSGQSAEVKGPYSIDGSTENVQCLPINASSAPSFKVTTNATEPKSCEPVGLFLSGGTPPYTATIVIEGVGIISRAMNGKDDVYTWFNVAPSGLRVIFSAQDRDGKLAASSRIITSAGDSDTCPRSSFSSKYKKPWSKARTIFFVFAISLPASLIGVILALIVACAIIYFLFLLIVLAFVWLRRMVRCGDVESGPIGDDIPDTRPHTPAAVGQPNEEGPSRPGTPTSIGSSTAVATQIMTQPTIYGSSLTGAKDEPKDDKVQEQKAVLDEKT